MKVKDLYEMLSPFSEDDDVFVIDGKYGDFFTILTAHKDEDNDLIIIIHDQYEN